MSKQIQQKPKPAASGTSSAAVSFQTPNKPTQPANASNTNPNNPSSELTHNNHSSAAKLGLLVGRPLVPFFSDSGEENTTQKVDQNRNFGVGEAGSSVKLRQFVDGYFVDSGSLNANPANNNSNSNNSNESAYNQTQSSKSSNKSSNKKSAHSTPVKSQPAHSAHTHANSYANVVTSSKKSTKPNGHHRSNSNNNSHANSTSSNSNTDSSKVFAAPAFTNAPSPLKIPLPNFLKNKSNNNSSSPTINSIPANTTESELKLGPSLLHLIKPPQQQTPAPIQQSTMSPSPTHDPVTGLPSSLMHLVLGHSQSNAQTHLINPPTIINPAYDYQTSNSPQPTPILLPPTALVNTTSAPVHNTSTSHITNTFSSTPQPVISPNNNQTNSTAAPVSTFSPKLLFLRAGGDNQQAVVTSVPILPQTVAPIPHSQSAINPSQPHPSMLHYSSPNLAYNPYQSNSSTSQDLSASLKQLLQIK